MTASEAELAPLRAVALRLGELRDDVVFVGGAVLPLLISDAGAPPVRATDDVDLIVELTSRKEYPALRGKLERLGFKEDAREGAPLCRWIIDGIVVDIMPTDPSIYGFSNPWYEHALRTAESTSIGADLAIRVISAPSFVATKLAAFNGRGKGEWHVSHDIEDIVAILDGRPCLVREVEGDEDAVRSYLSTQLQRLLHADGEDIVRAHLRTEDASDLRLPFVVGAIRRIARKPTILALGDTARSQSGGSPGGTGQATEGPWEYRVDAIETVDGLPERRAMAGAQFVVVSSTLTSFGSIAGTAGDGRDVLLEDARGDRHPPSFAATLGAAARMGVRAPHDTIWSGQPFATVWVYEVPRTATERRLRLPFGGYEIVVP